MGVALLNRGAIVVFVGGSSSLSRWFRKRKGGVPAYSVFRPKK